MVFDPLWASRSPDSADRRADVNPGMRMMSGWPPGRKGARGTDPSGTDKVVVWMGARGAESGEGVTFELGAASVDGAVAGTIAGAVPFAGGAASGGGAG